MGEFFEDAIVGLVLTFGLARLILYGLRFWQGGVFRLIVAHLISVCFLVVMGSVVLDDGSRAAIVQAATRFAFPQLVWFAWDSVREWFVATRSRRHSIQSASRTIGGRTRKPLSICTRCSSVAFYFSEPDQRCTVSGAGQHCKGTLRVTKPEDWYACRRCHGTGRTTDAACTKCNEVGWFFVPARSQQGFARPIAGILRSASRGDPFVVRSPSPPRRAASRRGPAAADEAAASFLRGERVRLGTRA